MAKNIFYWSNPFFICKVPKTLCLLKPERILCEMTIEPKQQKNQNATKCKFHGMNCLTHWGRDKMAAIFQTIFSNAFSWMKMYKFRLRFHWSLFPRVQLTIFQHWFRWWLGAGQATSHYLNQWSPSLLMQICVTRPQFVNIPNRVTPHKSP